MKPIKTARKRVSNQVVKTISYWMLVFKFPTPFFGKNTTDPKVCRDETRTLGCQNLWWTPISYLTQKRKRKVLRRNKTEKATSAEYIWRSRKNHQSIMSLEKSKKKKTKKKVSGGGFFWFFYFLVFLVGEGHKFNDRRFFPPSRSYCFQYSPRRCYLKKFGRQVHVIFYFLLSQRYFFQMLECRAPEY